MLELRSAFVYKSFTSPEQRKSLVDLTSDLHQGEMAVEFPTLSTNLSATCTQVRRESAALWAVVSFGERAVAFLLLLVLFPWLFGLAVVIVVLSRRSPLVRHGRVGQHGIDLHVLKFRTMWGVAAPCRGSTFFIEYVTDLNAAQLKLQLDPRVTSRFAAFCRKYSIDELPQLWHVLRGDMSLVGPRPLTAHEIRRYYGSDAGTLLVAKPGLSGLWQVSGRSGLDRERRRQLDLFMIENWSVQLYWSILKATIPIVVSGRNAW